jgi:hypothetical protein
MMESRPAFWSTAVTVVHKFQGVWRVWGQWGERRFPTIRSRFDLYRQMSSELSGNPRMSDGEVNATLAKVSYVGNQWVLDPPKQ